MVASCSTLQTSVWWWWVANKRAFRGYLDTVCNNRHWFCKYGGVLGWGIGSYWVTFERFHDQNFDNWKFERTGDMIGTLHGRQNQKHCGQKIVWWPWEKIGSTNSWITRCMLKCRKIWCMFFMKRLPTSILEDTSLGTWNSVAVWSNIIARQSLGQNSANIGPYLQTNTWVWNCHASHDFQFAHVGIDESAIKKHWRITAQNVAINCWLGSTEWRGLVWHDASNESPTQCGFGTLPYSTMDGTTCQTQISLLPG